MKVTVLRHGDYDEDTLNLSEEGRQWAVEHGKKLVWELGISQDVSDILLVSSSAPRAYQTTEAIREGLGLPQTHTIHDSEFLWQDNEHEGKIDQALAFIDSLPSALFLIIVTHLNVVFPLSWKLGYKGEYHKPDHLEWPVFVTNKSIIKRSLWPVQSVSERDRDYEWYGWRYEFNIILDGRRVISLMEVFSRLKSQKGTWQKIIDPTDGEIYQFLVPYVCPSDDPEYSMSGWYDQDGIFPIVALFHTREERKTHEWDKLPDIPDISQIQAMRWIFGELEEIIEESPF